MADTEATPVPTVVERTTQPYVGVRAAITVDGFPEIADRMPGLFGWLAERGAAPAGPPFFRYLVVDMPRLEVEAGVPVAEPLTGDGEVFAGELPAGSYATVVRHGHPSGLLAATEELLVWARERGLRWDRADEPGGGERWTARLESYLTDPAVQPDLDEWDVELAFRLAD